MLVLESSLTLPQLACTEQPPVVHCNRRPLRLTVPVWLVVSGEVTHVIARVRVEGTSCCPPAQPQLPMLVRTEVPSRLRLNQGRNHSTGTQVCKMTIPQRSPVIICFGITDRLSHCTTATELCSPGAALLPLIAVRMIPPSVVNSAVILATLWSGLRVSE